MKRFYNAVTVEPVDAGWRVMLDGRAIKTAAGKAQTAPTRALTEAMAEEWAGQGEEIDTSRFVLRDMADYAIDVVAPDRDAAIRSMLRFAETDTLLYRAEEREPLHDRQLEVWEPLVLAAERRWDVHFERVGGVIHRAQPAETITRMAGVLASKSDLELAALNTLASLSASMIVALAALEPGADPRALWGAANLEEDWQVELWGKDAEAEALRGRRFASFDAAMRFVTLARGT